MTDFTASKTIHFIGIGGIGISAVARMLAAEGKKISGSDRGVSEITTELEKIGVQIFIGQKAENIPADCGLVIYTVAVPADNPELTEAKKRGITLMTYPQTLEIISREKYTVAVSGTHGKTTTTAFLASILLEAKLDPTVLVGGLMKHPLKPQEERVNFFSGKGQYFVVEADEYKKSFHNLFPKVLIITSIDLDHLDFYKDLTDIQEAFAEVVRRLPVDGAVICNPNLSNVKPVLKGVKAKTIDYTKVDLGNVSLKLPGVHNRENAAAAAAAALFLDVPKETITHALTEFSGVSRRFEYKGKTVEGALVYDDYAHNPQKVAAAIAGARESFPTQKLFIIFQPHLYSRTKLLFPDFATAFTGASEVIFVPIYAARENLDPSITSEMLASAVINTGTSAQAVKGLDGAYTYMKNKAKAGDIIMTTGAGDITDLATRLVV